MHYCPFLCLLLFSIGKIFFFSQLQSCWDVIVTVTVQQIHYL